MREKEQTGKTGRAGKIRILMLIAGILLLLLLNVSKLAFPSYGKNIEANAVEGVFDAGEEQGRTERSAHRGPSGPGVYIILGMSLMTVGGWLLIEKRKNPE